jgi:dihydroflavonol-4-reductase
VSDGPAFVTGGSGFLGSALLARLTADGRRVVALARSRAAADAVRNLGAEPVSGDVLDLDSLTASMGGCSVVYHLAGVNAFCLRDPAPMFRINVDGTRTVVRAAARAGIGRVVHTSSAATIGEARGTVGSEDSPHRGSFLSSYERSKHEAEQVAFEAADAEGIELVSVNPASVQGPGRTGGTARLLIDYLNGRLRAIVDTRLSLVDIADCTEGHVLGEAHGRAGRRYILSGAAVTTREAVAALAEISGLERTPRVVPAPLAVCGAAAAETVGRLRRRDPGVCREMVRTMLHGHAYDGTRAVRELGLRYTPLHETLQRTLAWYVENGYVSRPLPGIAGGTP